ncbi:MAG: hypothetical protein DRI65_02080 [Chloroflexota bacterium]|nr:MAG: hypothetical protein DRI65_02080 [Chloroflexota bacterium]
MKSRTKWTILLTFSCFLFLFTACSPTPCGPIYDVTKPDDTNDGDCTPGDCSLREAVNKANSCPGLQTINLPADGYTLTLDGDDENLGATGDLDVTDDLVIIGTGAPSINGNIERAFHVHSGVTATFEGIWLTDGDAIYGGGLVNEGDLSLNNFTCNYNNVSIPPGGMGDAMGGCIFNTSNLTVNNGQFLANTAGYGGAVYNLDNATALIENNSFTGNEAEFNGGALWNGVDAEFTVNNSTLEMNEAGVDGGGVWNHGDFYGEGLVLEDNHAIDRGGAIYVWMDTFTQFNNSWLTENSANWGGGLFNNNGMVHFYESGITNNTATGPVGGGIYNNGPVPTGGLLLKNVTISNNTALGGVGGAGIYNTGNFDFRFITVSGNDPEGLRIDTGGEIKIRSSILADNPGGNCAGIAPDSLDYNLTSDSTCALTGSHDILNVTALIEPLGFHGGLAPSHPLTYGSPALDSGSHDLCISMDQNYTSRPQGPWCDRGAFENLYDKGIVRGWTYIDTNRDDIRDPAEGAVPGVIIDLKEGPCPGGAIAASAVSNPDGYYRIYEIEPGDYCLDTSPLQQNMYPEYIDLSFSPGDVLEDVNFRYLESPLGESSISGRVWHDLCAVPYGMPTSPPPGCIWLPGGGLGADGIYDPLEPGIGGVKIMVHDETCLAAGMILTARVYTEANGEYTIPGLEAGTYCVWIYTPSPPNDSILIPGNWTYPVRNAYSVEVDVSPGVGEDVTDVNFGWDYEFLPEPLIPYSYLCTVNMDAFIRRGPGTDFLPIKIVPEGEIFEVFAKSEIEEPLWLFGKGIKGKFGWMSELVLDCEEPDPTRLDTRLTPLHLPTPTPTSVPLVCTRDLNETQCIRAGGTWQSDGGITALKYYCKCPGIN